MSVEIGRSARFNTFKLEGVLKLIYPCLAGVTVEHLGWSDFIMRYDRSNTLFYLELPYWSMRIITERI
ncbi:Uncharacterised protein [Candidatus Bartonella washoeensis]|uniref:Uncharacterized protein n=1 Tax=Candidatus Bartonella washoeensis Sb944nv TaxID=1094563 RepID=J0YSS3_9HYPH|nr:hypothetical protein [Bartonella washoeensis]EJF77883.1 hypothetical protein MCQ_01326 [Bartonella washoeensis Sb944nv]SPU27544.1 Uncharacterised protein [Bartonella washoeensis]